MSRDKLNNNIKRDCIFFVGYLPCIYHKKHGVTCGNCTFYKPIRKRILLIKIGEAGEVVRNTPLIIKLRKEFPDAEITWLTKYPELVPSNCVDRILSYSWENVFYLKSQKYDILYNLDKEPEICAIAEQIEAREKYGFTLDKLGKVVPYNQNAHHKWLTGIFDDVMQKNKKHYVEEIFEICGFRWEGEEYILPEYEIPSVNFKKKSSDFFVGLNTGVGKRWRTRLWPEKHWLELIHLLSKKGHRVLLLGGKDEEGTNKYLAKETGALYAGHHSIKNFVGLMNYCDLIVTSVTMTLHIAIGLKKKIVLLNNVFNRHEFHLYQLGTIIEPPLSCLACYKNVFDENCPVQNCMELISPTEVYEKIIQVGQRSA
jgi:ADP-heptose:LPS heptosyltransferase